MRHLASNLYRIRVARRESQAAVARNAGRDFNQQYVSALERGIFPRKAEHVAALAAALGVEESALTRRVRA
jgi:transcriptional regulator with XRE-family HTH domain